MRTLVLGGARAGKSARAEQLLAGRPTVRRLSLESTPNLVTALREDPDTATLVDHLGHWSADAADLPDAVAQFRGDLVIVSTDTESLAAANLAVGSVCDDVELIVAGRVFVPTESVVAPAAPAETPTSANVAPTTPVPAPVPSPAEQPSPSEQPAPTEASASPVPASSAALDPTDAELFDVIDLPDDDVADAARARLLTLTKPPNALGRLEDLGVWISSCQGVCPPRRITAPAVVVFAGDHGVAREGVSAFPAEVTSQMVANIAAGGAAINVLARRAGASVQVLDMSVDTDDPDPHVARYKVRRSTGDLRRGEAMTLAEARRAVAAGRAVADQLVDAGADLLIAGDMGIGNTTPAAVLTGTVTGKEPVVVVGRGTGIDDAGWIRKTAAIRDGLRHGRRHRHDPLSLLAAVAGPDLAAMAGFLAQSALRKTPVILDGMVVTSAALIANALAPGAVAWWCAGHRSTEPAHGFALAELGLEPILELSMRLGEGSGAVTALPVVADAVDIMIDMATFGEAGVADQA
ncbi:nicotinate-nucleotide--dimethylbenzimidazole phosphoribosyltransferase [Gordonia alkaliphila]|uniref:Nicotinate-nucleotide--dimethylbenzimidazole phosphoribosyltransferase n=1 Tax=Gordonia alkaliphila TaxID=1053547 RepID=A0ABP8Z508_9ACTN